MATVCLQDVIAAIGQFQEYNLLWEDDRDKALQEFIATDPQLPDFEEKIKFYEQLESKVQKAEDCCNVGPVSIYTGKVHTFCNFLHRVFSVICHDGLLRLRTMAPLNMVWVVAFACWQPPRGTTTRAVSVDL